MRHVDTVFFHPAGARNISGHLGDTISRKKMLITTLVMVGPKNRSPLLDRERV